MTILYTNDAHSHLLSFDFPGHGKDIGGIARRQAYIKSIRDANRRTIVLDAGDLLQGTPFYSFFKGEVDIKAYSLCGYDAATLGNHDLDDALGNLKTQLGFSSFPIICSNIVYSDSLNPVFDPYKIFDLDGVEIGVIGCMATEPWSVISLNNRTNLSQMDVFTCVASVASFLRPRVDLLILLSHSAYQLDLEIAKRVPSLDIIIGGHSNTLLEKPVIVENSDVLSGAKNGKGIDGTLVLQDFKWGAYVGRLDLNIASGGRVISYSGSLKLMNNSVPIAADSTVARLVSGYEERINALTSQIIGKCESEMPYPEEERHLHDLPLGTFFCEALRKFTGADLSIINSGTIRDGLPVGNLTMGHLFNALPFDNTLVTYNMKGNHIEEMLQYICSNYGGITGYQYGGVTCTYNTVINRVIDIKIGDDPLRLDKIYKLATISYMADGNQHGDELFKKAFDKVDHGFLMRDAVLQYLKQHDTVVPPSGGRITIISAPASLSVK